MLNDTLQAKFKCEEVRDTDFGAGKVAENVTLRPVYSSDPTSENYSWSQATPAGELTMNITNPQAFGHFVKGQEYMLNMAPVEK